MRTRLVPLVAAFALTVGLVASRAQDAPPPGRLAQARALVEAMGLDTTGAQVLALMQDQVRAAPGLPPGFGEALTKAARPEELTAALAAAYAEELDDETIAAALAFYRTPAGKKLAKAQPTLTLRAQRAVSAWSQKVVQAAMQAQGLPDPAQALADARKHGNEAAALGALRTLGTSQALFREGDKDGNQVLDYADSLELLGKYGLIDAVLASGTRQGYRFELCHGDPPEFLWMATATPVEPGVSGDRYFVTNHEGVTYYSREHAFTLDRKGCKIPKDATPVGR